MAFNEKIELNNVVKDMSSGKISEKSAVVEIFSRMVQGKDIGDIKDGMGRKVDINAATQYIKDLNYQAAAGNKMAISELNEIRRHVIWPLLERRLQLLGMFGRYERVGYNESIVVEPITRVGELSRVQANRGDVVFGTTDRDAYTVKPISIAAGHMVDYRRNAAGDLAIENMLIEQIVTNMWNKASGYVLYTLYNKIMNATGVKFFSHGAGITKAQLDQMIINIGRYGQSVSIFGDRAVTQQIAAFIGWAGMTPVYGGTPGTPAQVSGVSQQLLSEFLTTGAISNYMGATVSAIDNPFDYSHIITDASGNMTYDTLFPQGFLFVVPVGIDSPVRTWTVGGLTSMSGEDVQTGSIMTRFDLSVAADITSNRISQIGLIVDDTFPIPTNMASY